MRGLRDKMRILPRPKLREANKRVDGSAPGLTSVGALRFARPQAGKILSRIGTQWSANEHLLKRKRNKCERNCPKAGRNYPTPILGGWVSVSIVFH
jgi:hypothetical protein